MSDRFSSATVRLIASEIDTDIQALPVHNTPSVRAVRRGYSRQLRKADGRFVLDLARELLRAYGHRWVAYELIAAHKEAFRSLGPAELEELGTGELTDLIHCWRKVSA